MVAPQRTCIGMVSSLEKERHFFFFSVHVTAETKYLTAPCARSEQIDFNATVPHCVQILKFGQLGNVNTVWLFIISFQLWYAQECVDMGSCMLGKANAWIKLPHFVLPSCSDHAQPLISIERNMASASQRQATTLNANCNTISLGLKLLRVVYAAKEILVKLEGW